MSAQPRLSYPLVAGIALLALLGFGCEDPLGKLNEARQAMTKQAPKAGSDARAFADDEEAKVRANGLSLGPEHISKRLYYQFVDDKGRVRFVERLTDVPEPWRERVGFVEMDTPPPLSPMMAQATRDAKYAHVAQRVRQQQLVSHRASGQIVLYSADWCGWCKKAKSHLDAKGINYVIRDIDEARYLNELVSKTGQKGIPVLDVGGKIVTGFSPERYDALIRENV